MGIDRTSERGPIVPAKACLGPRAGAGGVKAPRAFEVGPAHTAATNEVAPVAPAATSPLARLRAGEIDLDRYLDLKVDEATAHLKGLRAHEMSGLRSLLRAQLVSDPSMLDLVQQATGQRRHATRFRRSNASPLTWYTSDALRAHSSRAPRFAHGLRRVLAARIRPAPVRRGRRGLRRARPSCRYRRSSRMPAPLRGRTQPRHVDACPSAGPNGEAVVLTSSRSGRSAGASRARALAARGRASRSRRGAEGAARRRRWVGWARATTRSSARFSSSSTIRRSAPTTCKGSSMTIVPALLQPRSSSSVLSGAWSQPIAVPDTNLQEATPTSPTMRATWQTCWCHGRAGTSGALGA